MAELAGFSCRRCGNCCRIRDGIVRVSDEEVARIARFLRLPEDVFIDRYTDLAPDRRGLVLKSAPAGDCIFLDARNYCEINPVKPDKCRTFPHEWTNADSREVCPALADLPSLR